MKKNLKINSNFNVENLIFGLINISISEKISPVNTFLISSAGPSLSLYHTNHIISDKLKTIIGLE